MKAKHVRETPAPPPLQCSFNDPAHPDVGDAAKELKEPVLKVDQIQGSILPGFNKDHRMLIFITIMDGQELNFKRWLNTQVPFIATADEVLAFNRLFKFAKFKRKSEGTVKSTWTNVAFSFKGLEKLTSELDFIDKPFINGLANQSASLGDPANANAEGHPDSWLVGGKHNEAHVLFIVEADDRGDMLTEVSRIENSLAFYENKFLLKSNFADIIFKDEGANLPPPLTAHEHFGFLDGISQPGIRGLISEDTHDVLTIRQNPNKRDNTVTNADTGKDEFKPAQGKPGQDLLWPGEFVFGYQKQQPDSTDISVPGEFAKAGTKSGPAWTDNGSFLVFRRLRQDVGAFHLFLRDTADALKIKAPSNSSPARLVGAKLVGRWPSGAPVEREPEMENPALADEDCANNNFEFGEEGKEIAELPANHPEFSPFNCVDSIFPRAEQDDKNGLRCPFTGHIRKAYPRDDESNDKTIDTGKDNCNDSRSVLSEENTQTHRLLRRGLPYGPVSRSTPETPFDDEVDRGLQFLAYQTSIENQFEFVTNCWINNPDFKEPKGTSAIGNPIDPKTQGGGHDPIIGQNSKKGDGRIREFVITIPETGKAVRISTADFVEKTGKTDWVIPTGGGYFFTPSIDALKNVLSIADKNEDKIVEMPEGAGEVEAAVTPAAN